MTSRQGPGSEVDWAGVGGSAPRCSLCTGSVRVKSGVKSTCAMVRRRNRCRSPVRLRPATGEKTLSTDCVASWEPIETLRSQDPSGVVHSQRRLLSAGLARGGAELMHGLDSSVPDGVSGVSCECVRSSVDVPSASFCPIASSSGSSLRVLRVLVSVLLVWWCELLGFWRLSPLCSLRLGLVRPISAARLSFRLLT